MSNAQMALIMQAIVTFIIGIILTANGLPSDRGGAVLMVGNEMVETIGENTDNPYVKENVVNAKETYRILGIALTLGSTLELLALVLPAMR